MNEEKRLQELKETLQELADEEFIIEIPLGEEGTDAEETL